VVRGLTERDRSVGPTIDCGQGANPWPPPGTVQQEDRSLSPRREADG